jgi:hypothetical protein
MVTQARMVMSGVAAVMVVGVAVWAWLPRQHASVEVKQLDAPSWTVQITELGLATAEPAVR